MGWSNEWGKPEQTLIIGVDKGSAEGDKTVVSITDGKTFTVIGEDVLLEIPIKGGWGKNAVKAIQVGDLAVHEALGWNEEYNWQVTHVPTLTMFDRAIPDGNWSREQLIMWCWKVQENLHMQWDNFRQFDNTNYNDIKEEDKIQLVKHCLSIGIE